MFAGALLALSAGGLSGRPGAPAGGAASVAGATDATLTTSLAAKSDSLHMEVVTLGYDRAVVHVATAPASSVTRQSPEVRLRVCTGGARGAGAGAGGGAGDSTARRRTCQEDFEPFRSGRSLLFDVSGLTPSTLYKFELLSGSRVVLSRAHRTLLRPEGRRLSVVGIISDTQLTDVSDHYFYDPVVVGSGRSWADETIVSTSLGQRHVIPSLDTSPDPLRMLAGNDSSGQMFRHSVRLASAALQDYQGAAGRRPSVLVLRGDLVQGGRESEFRRVAAMIRDSPVPVITTMGNHDAMVTPDAEGPRGWRRHLGRSGGDSMVDIPGLRIVMMDTSWTEVEQGVQHEGLVTNEQLKWLKGAIFGSKLPVVLLPHHPIDRTFKEDGSLAAQAITGILGSGPVWAYLSGHAHRDSLAAADWRAGAMVGASGSTVLYPCTYAMLEVFEGGLVQTSHMVRSLGSAGVCEESRRIMNSGPHPEVAGGRGEVADRNFTIVFNQEDTH